MIQTRLFSAGTVWNEFRLLTAPECSHLCDVVLSASSHWKRRARGVDFFTLGAAYYLDVDDDAFVSYSLRLSKMNPVPNELFADLYELILGRFEQVFGCPFCFHGGLALPGFHIFGPRPGRSPSILNPAFFDRGGTIHHHPLPRSFAELIGCLPDDLPTDFDSVTIPLCLPASGGGLNVWPNGIDDEQPVFHSYSVGQAVHFNGELWHQLAPYRLSSNDSQSDYRITLQCHFFRMHGSSILFF